VSNKKNHKTKGEVTVYANCGDFVVCVDSEGNKFDAYPGDLSVGAANAGGGGDVVSLFPSRSESQLASTPQQIQVRINSITASELYRAFRGIGRTNANSIVTNKPSGGYRNWQQLEAVNMAVPGETWVTLREQGAFAFD
jgi:hypothetical protein